MKRLLLLVLAGFFVTLTGCGGGGSGSSGGGTSSSVSGMAALGIIKNGTVKVYALNNDGSQGALLATTSTDDRGNYSADLGTYSGPVIAFAFGSYTDEATGATVTLAEANAIRAALPQASGVVSLSITGLTELAVQKAGTLTPTNIQTANAAISSIFKVDITGTKPVDATAAAMGATTDLNRINYTLALAGLSQLASTSTGANATAKLQSALATLGTAITATGSGSVTGQTAATFSNAVSTYLGNNSDVETIIVKNGGSPVLNIGSSTQALITISLAGAGTTPCGTQFTLTLPAGVTVNAQSDGTANGILGVVGTVGKYTAASGGNPATLTVGAGSGVAIADGAIVVINANLAAGTTVTKDSFAISGSSFKDAQGAPLTGPSLSVSSVTTK